MTKAEIHGKISHTGSNLTDQLEDLLTSDVFSACRYVRPETILLPFLRGATSLDNTCLAEVIGEGPCDRVIYRFWPPLRQCEPDVLLAIEDGARCFHLVMVEAKYYSAKSSAALGEDELSLAEAPSDQLAREYTDLQDPVAGLGLTAHFAEDHVASRSLVYVTAHRSMPKEAMMESLGEIGHFRPGDSAIKLFWASWFDFYPVLSSALPLEYERPILEDLRLLLLKKRLVRFNGFGGVRAVESLGACCVYTSPSRRRSNEYDFIGTPETILDHPVFYASASKEQTYSWQLPALQPLGNFYRRSAP